MEKRKRGKQRRCKSSNRNTKKVNEGKRKGVLSKKKKPVFGLWKPQLPHSPERHKANKKSLYVLDYDTCCDCLQPI